jgi:hypothetical protein
MCEVHRRPSLGHLDLSVPGQRLEDHEQIRRPPLPSYS